MRIQILFMDFLYYWNFMIPLGNGFPYAESWKWLHLGLYFSAEYHNWRRNIIILFWKYLVDISSEAWQNLFWEHINVKLFALPCKNQYRIFETNFTRKRNCAATVPISTFMCLWGTYVFPQWICLFFCNNMWSCWPILGYINRSQTHECGNWDWGRAIPFLGIHKWYFRCSLQYNTSPFIAKHLSLWKEKPDCCGTINCGIYKHCGRCTTGPFLIALVQWLALTLVPPWTACTPGNRCIILRALLCFLKMTLRSRE